MRGLRTRPAWSVVVALCVVAAVPVATSRRVHAGTGFNQFNWGGPNITLSSTSYRYSNMTGFWQAILNSNGCSVAVDGNYGNLTTWNTDNFAIGLFGTHNNGIMTPAWLNLFQNADSVYGKRLAFLDYIDGYGTRHYSYYGGYDYPVRLGWNPISSQWLFAQRPASNPTSLVAATPNRTISSVAACA